jgi:hypothetical protein
VKDLFTVAVWALAGASVGTLALGLFIAGVHRVVGNNDSIPKEVAEGTQRLPALLLWVRAYLRDGSLLLALKAGPAAVFLTAWFGLQLVSRTPRADSAVTSLSNSGSPNVIDAYLGKPTAAMGRVSIFLEKVNRPSDSFEAKVKVDDEPEFLINGVSDSRFRDRGHRIEIQAAYLDQGFVRFKVWIVQH